MMSLWHSAPSSAKLVASSNGALQVSCRSVQWHPDMVRQAQGLVRVQTTCAHHVLPPAHLPDHPLRIMSTKRHSLEQVHSLFQKLSKLLQKIMFSIYSKRWQNFASSILKSREPMLYLSCILSLYYTGINNSIKHTIRNIQLKDNCLLQIFLLFAERYWRCTNNFSVIAQEITTGRISGISCFTRKLVKLKLN